jgi:DNA recombination protein RmuC
MNEPLLWVIAGTTTLSAIFALLAFLKAGNSGVGAGKEVRDELRAGRDETRTSGTELRQELASGLQATARTLADSLASAGTNQQQQLDVMAKRLNELDESNRASLERIRETFDARFKSFQESNETKITEMRTAMSEGLRLTGETLAKSSEAMAKAQKEQLEGVSVRLKELDQSNQASLERVRSTFDARVQELQASNEKKLDEMRKTVDEKLHDTLEKRLGESFKLVSDRLDTVHKGLGEMQNLATGVGDLKRVLTNVKARGTWAEVQLGAILEQVLTAEQFEKNVCVKPETSERVEFAVRLPGPKDDPAACVYLPIDSKFPQEDYAKLQDASDAGDPIAVQRATDALLRTIRSAAKEIHDKYVNPPATTDFAIMFLATEGLYAEVLRQPALLEDLQQNFRIVVAGPTTLVAILSSLRVGFQTLAIEQRASEVWRVLAAVKTEFGKFGGVLAKVKKQLQTAARTIDDTDTRTRAMERKLRSVQELPGAEAESLLGIPDFRFDDDRDAGREEAAVIDGETVA